MDTPALRQVRAGSHGGSGEVWQREPGCLLAFPPSAPQCGALKAPWKGRSLTTMAKKVASDMDKARPARSVISKPPKQARLAVLRPRDMTYKCRKRESLHKQHVMLGMPYLPFKPFALACSRISCCNQAVDGRMDSTVTPSCALLLTAALAASGTPIPTS